MRTRTIPAVAVLLLATAGCGSHTVHAAARPSATQPPSVSHTPTPSISSPPATPTGTPSASNITLSGQGHYLPPGPFTIKPIKCGRYTAAEKTQFGTNATSGLIFKYTNMGNTLTDSPILTVNFTAGSNVVGDNVNGDPADVGPGQSAETAVDAVSDGGGALRFSSCELMTYSLSQGGGTYAP